RIQPSLIKNSIPPPLAAKNVKTNEYRSIVFTKKLLKMLAFFIDSKTIAQFGGVWEECAGEKGERPRDSLTNLMTRHLDEVLH
ncbi:MAG: hypothetical protein PUF78_07255, partial [Lachnospiraceae bacterium]|nr:hypothetical protein [Lachnospiraceae bacterium]